MAEVFVVRHGQASFGSTNYDRLSELGIQQSTLLGRYFADNGFCFDNATSGTLSRQLDTMGNILTALSKPPSQHQMEDWNEFDFMAVVTEFIHQNPARKPQADTPKPVFYQLLKDAMLAWARDEVETSETWQAFVNRVSNAFTHIQKNQPGTSLVVTSGGVIAALLHKILNLDLVTAIEMNLQIRNTSVNHFFVNAQRATLSGFNHLPHLNRAEHLELFTYS